MEYKAVLFDLGGVVLDSPFVELYKYEEELSLPKNFFNKLIVTTGENGAWARMERGEVTVEEFAPLFEQECKAAGATTVDGLEFMRRLERNIRPRSWMLAAIKTIRNEGLKTCAITNNWRYSKPAPNSSAFALNDYFDVIIESSIVGVRKPHPRIFEIALEKLSVSAKHCIYLDDIGMNLKAPRAMGMTTIKVELLKPHECLVELEKYLGFKLTHLLPNL